MSEVFTAFPAEGIEFLRNLQWNNNHPDWHREDLTLLLDLLKTRQIQPVIAERVPLEQAAQAHRLLDQGVRSKVVLTVNSN